MIVVVVVFFSPKINFTFEINPQHRVYTETHEKTKKWQNTLVQVLCFLSYSFPCVYQPLDGSMGAPVTGNAAVLNSKGRLIGQLCYQGPLLLVEVVYITLLNARLC